MPSDFTATLNLEPFFQRFLTAHFNKESGEVFSFPAKHDGNILLEHIVSKNPPGAKPQSYGENTFRVLLPYSEFKNPAVYNYVSETRQAIFRSWVRRYMNMLFHDRLTRSVKKLKLTRIEAIDDLKDEFGFLPCDTDRLLKEYMRWYKCENMQKYRRKIRRVES